MWVSLRGISLSEPPAFGNRIGAVYLKLPLQEGDLMTRVDKVKRMTASLNGTPEPFIAYALMQVVGLLPRPIAQFFFKMIAFKVTTSTSNMPGPRYGVALGKVEIDEMVFFVPPQRTIGE